MWYLKQLLPLYYQSHYTTQDNVLHFTTWQMWFGKVFCCKDRTWELK